MGITPAVILTGLVLILAINLRDVRFFGSVRNHFRYHQSPRFIGVISVPALIFAGGGPNSETIGFASSMAPNTGPTTTGSKSTTGNFCSFCFSPLLSTQLSASPVLTLS